MPNRPREGTHVRGVRLDDTDWQAAQELAATEDRTASDVIRDALRSWLREPPPIGGPTPLPPTD